MADIGIIIPAYHAADTIARAALSTLAQPGVAVETVVVVDDQCEKTRDTVRAINDPRVHVLMNDHNRGAQFSRNAGLAHIDAPYCMFLDGDDFITGDLLAPLLAAMKAAEADIGFGPWLWWNEDRNLCMRTVPKFTAPAHAFDVWLTERKWVPPCAVVWRTDFLRTIGGWDEAIGRNQDGEVVLRGILVGAAIAMSRQGAGVYFQHSSEHRITASTRNYQSLVDVAEKLRAMPSDVLSVPVRDAIIARYLYAMASVAFKKGDAAFGQLALTRSRELGFRGTRGSRIARLGAALLGLERYHGWSNTIRRRFGGKQR